MKHISHASLFLFTFALSLSVPAWAKIEMGAPFTDHAVLQRDRAVPVWGKAAPGSAITVVFAGQETKATAGADGAWRVDLKPMPASKESRTMTVTETLDSQPSILTISDILVGEVWFASGQSNMECPIWGGNARYRDGNGALVCEMTKLPYVRYVKNPQKWSVEPFAFKAAWCAMTPENLRKVRFSAVAYYYARELYLALDMPIGIVDSSWGGTNIDAWTPRCGYDGCDASLSNTVNYKVTAKWNPTNAVGAISAAIQQPTVLFNGMVAAFAPMAMRGFIWYQGCHNSGESSKYCAKMHALYNGWSRSFENKNLKLYFVQLAPWWSTWMGIVTQQNKFVAEEPNAAIAVTADVGNPWDIHPNQKEIVAKRLAVHALKRDYGFDIAEDDSPVLKGAEFLEEKVVLTFDNVKSWYVYAPDMTIKPPFEIADVPGHWFPAEIENLVTSSNKTTHVVKKHPSLKGTQVILSAKEIKKPTCVRYLANRFEVGTLYNEMALPLGPFECKKPDQKFQKGESGR